MGGGTNRARPRGRSQRRRKLYSSPDRSMNIPSAPQMISAAESRDDDNEPGAIPHGAEDVTERWWREYQRSASTQSRSTTISSRQSDDIPDLSIVPTDEIMDACVNKKKPTIPFVDDDDDNLSRDSRDQYQIGRLQARIKYRRELSREHIEEDRSPSLKSLRSKRINTVRNLYKPNEMKSGEQSVHGSTNCSTVPSLMPGKTVSSSTIVSSVQLSEYRSQIFSDMLGMLKDVSNIDTLQDDELTHIKTVVMDKSIASCGSVALNSLIQKLAEEELTRILTQFEQVCCTHIVLYLWSRGYIVSSALPHTSILNHSQTNSLVDLQPPPQQLEGIPEYEVEEDNDLMDKQVETQMTSNINFPPHVYDNMITSKLSDVTTPTQHDGFELDEIVDRKQKTMPQLLSPVAETAASSASTNGALQHLPCIIVEMSEEESSNEGKDSDLISSEIEVEKEERCNDANKATKANLEEPEVLDDSEKSNAVPCVIEEEDADKFVAVAKQEDILFDITELMEVTSILSQYEEKAESARKEKEKAFWEKMDQEAKARQRAKSDDVSEPFDEEKKVRFLEDQASPNQEAVCGGNGCTIQEEEMKV